MDRDLDASEQEFREYLKGMTSTQEGAMHRQLKVLEDMWEKYNFENESATAEDVLEKMDPGEDVNNFVDQASSNVSDAQDVNNFVDQASSNVSDAQDVKNFVDQASSNVSDAQ